MEAAGTIPAQTLEAITGLTDRRHRQLAKEGFFPPPQRGRYLTRETLTGLFKYYRESATRRTGTLAEEREAKLRAERKLAELDLAKRTGELIELAAAERFTEALVAAFVNHLDPLPSKLASITGLPHIKRPLEDELDRIRTDLARLKLDTRPPA
jgi:hypothetical protein